MVRLVCARSLLCNPDHPDADDEFVLLIQSIQNHPVEGDTHDASGNPVHVRVDEDALLNFVVTYRQNFVNTGEILAAGAALQDGDTAPLLRLAAEGSFTLIGDSGDPTGFSAGDYYARVCADAQNPWDWSDLVAERQEQYAEAISDLPTNFFAPFSRSAATGILYSIAGHECLWWQIPTPPSPMVSPHAVYPRVPTLVLDGDIDNRVPLEESEGVADLFPHSIFVKVVEAGHYTIDYSLCAQGLVAQFIENLHADTSCASTPYQIFPAVGRFPVLAKRTPIRLRSIPAGPTRSISNGAQGRDRQRRDRYRCSTTKHYWLGESARSSQRHLSDHLWRVMDNNTHGLRVCD